MTTLYLLYSEHRYGGDIINPEDHWSSREDEHIEFNALGVVASRDDADRFPEAFEVKEDVAVGDVVHVVIVRYGTGDTFGHTWGSWSLMGASTDEEKAQELVDAINKDTYTGDEEAATGYSYAPWRGYFESLESCDLHTFVVK